MYGKAVRTAVAAAIAAIEELAPFAGDESAAPLFVFHLAECGALADLRVALGDAYAFCDGRSPSPELLDALVWELVNAGAADVGEAEELRQEAARRAAIAHAKFLSSLFSPGDRQASCTSWALACDAQCAAYAPYLRYLFPRARILFLCRHPVDAYRSYLAQADSGAASADPRPRRKLLTAEAFADRWSSAMECFAMEGEAAGMLVHHERLRAGSTAKLDDYLGISLRRPSDAASPETMCITISCTDEEIIARRARIQMSRLGFEFSPLGDTRAAPSRRDDRGKCVILVPVARYIEPLCDASLRELERRGYVVHRSYGCSAIDIARCRLATEALSEGFEETMWIDADTAFDPDDVDRIRSHRLPFACGILSRRRSQAGLAFVRTTGGESSVVFGEKGILLEISYAGAAFMSVQREVYVGIQRQMGIPTCNQSTGTPVVPFFMPMIEKRGGECFYLSEDYAFCRRARISGYKLFADTTLRLGHVGDYVYAVEDAFEQLTRYRSYRVAIDES